MSKQPRQTALGLMAVLLWSCAVGFPVLVLHLSSDRFLAVERVHAFVLFVTSQGLVYWLAARPRKSALPAKTPEPVQPVSPFANGSNANQIWGTELVPAYIEAVPPENGNRTAASDEMSGCFAATLLVTNYLGSSRPRIVNVEPGGIQRTLLPGQDLELTATASGQSPTFRIVESDLATQVYIDGVNVQVQERARCST